MGLSIFDERQSNTAKDILTAANTTVNHTFQGVMSFGAIARFDNMLIVNTDVIDHKVTFSVVNGSNVYGLGSVDVPAGAGTGGVAAVDAVPLLFPAGQQGLIVDNSGNYQWRVEVTITTGQVSLLCLGGNL